MQANFTNKVVLVTGASIGIGESIAMNFAKCGAKLALTGRNVKGLQSVADRCEKERGLKPLQIAIDLTEDQACETIAKKTLDYFGRLDVLVNNAGLGVSGTVQDTDMKNYDLVFQVNVRAVYNLTRLLASALIQSKGNIINISSIVATKPSVGYMPYAMSKAALDHFTRLAALELAPKGVRVNAVSPGITVRVQINRVNPQVVPICSVTVPKTPLYAFCISKRSKFLERILDLTEEETKPIIEKIDPTIPMGEACNGDDIAHMVLHIASDYSRLVTGTVVQVDGGYNIATA